jgi:hypothetical protein
MRPSYSLSSLQGKQEDSIPERTHEALNGKVAQTFISIPLWSASYLLLSMELFSGLPL